MRYQWWLAAVALTLGIAALIQAGEPGCCPPPQPSWLARIAPVGGCDPDGGGLLHWWDPHAFPRSGARDDYAHKKLPPIGWPAYPPFFQPGPPEDVAPCAACGKGR